MENKKQKLGMPIVFNTSLLVSSTILISALVAIYVFSWRSDRLYNAETLNNIEMLADTVSQQLVGPLAMNNLASIDRTMRDNIGGNTQVADAFIVYTDGNILYDLQGKRDGGNYSEKLLLPGLTYISRPILLKAGAIHGIQVEPQKLGSIHLGVEHKNFLRNERVRSAVSFAQSVSGNVADSVAIGDFLQVRDIIGNMVGGSKNIVYAQFLHMDGSILFYSERGKPDKESRKREGDMENTLVGKNALNVSIRRPLLIQNTTGPDGGPALDIAVPVLRKGQKLGVVRIGYSMADFMAAQRKSKALIAVMSLILISIGLAFTLWTAMRIAQPIRILADAARKIGEGDLDLTVAIDSGGRETRELGRSFNQMIAGLKERDFVKDTFGKYMTKQVADEILKNPGMIAPGGKKQEVTILFSDIRGFTTFAEGRPPDEVLSHLNEYMSAMVDVIIKYQGTVDKFIGDAIMAVYGSPLIREGDTLRAVKTALEMQQRLNELNESWARVGKPPFNIGIGINTGEVIVGNIGGIRRMEYTVIGDNVNTASRIEGLTKNYGCPIIISRSTYEKVKDNVIANKLESAAVKGKSQSVELFQLVALKT